MLKLKTKWFHKWAKKNAVSDNNLKKTIENLSNNIGTVDLGSGLYKVRTPKIGQGKSSGFRTIVVFREADIAVFIYGFAKSDKANLDNQELKYFKKLSKDLLEIERAKFIELEKQGIFISLKV